MSRVSVVTRAKLKQPAYRSNEFQRVCTSGNIFLSLATSQQTLLILCNVRVSVVLRLHGDTI